MGLIDPGRNTVSILQNSIRYSNSVEFFGYAIWNLKHQKFLWDMKPRGLKCVPFCRSDTGVVGWNPARSIVALSLSVFCIYISFVKA